MRQVKNSKTIDFTKNWVFWLLLFTILAIIIRSIPGWIYEAWGADFGIYFGLSKTVAETGELFPPYSGWGSSYNEFPITYLFNALAYWISGIDVKIIMPRLIPIFGGLCVLIFYFLSYELFKSRKISLISTLFFTFLPFHVYQTSHASPLTLGHFFMILSAYLFLKYRKKTKFIVPLLISTIFLIMSHHLTTYFYLIILIFIVFLENITVKNWTPTFKKDISYLFLITVIVFSYWSIVARTVFESFMSSGLSIVGIRLNPIFIVMLFYIIFFGMFFSIKLFRKKHFPLRKTVIYLSNFYKKISTRTDKKTFLNGRITLNRYAYKFILYMVIFYALLVLVIFLENPLTGSRISLEFIILVTPFIITLCFGISGFSYTYKKKNGKFITGWFLAVVISFFFGLITKNGAILPHRHLEYLMFPLAFMVVFGIGGTFSDPEFKQLLTNLREKTGTSFKNISKRLLLPKKLVFVNLVLIILLIISLASTVYYAHGALNASHEVITTENFDAILWISNNLDRNKTMIASDHRLARLAEAYNFNTTKDETRELWEAESLDEYIFELIGRGKNHSRITHIIIDDIMKYEVVHISFKVDGIISKYLRNETRLEGDQFTAYEKFQRPPFEMICRNESIEIDERTLEPFHWTEVYEVDWEYIENEYLLSKID